MNWYRRAVALLSGGAVMAACSGAGIEGSGLDGERKTNNATSTPQSSTACTNSGGSASTTKLDDPSILPACAPACAGAHCVPGSFVPASLTSQLAECSGGFCVPDSLIKTGGTVKPPSCKSIGDAEGVCMSVCVKQVAQFKDLLPQANCGADERCAPCINPLDGKPSGACDLGSAPAGGSTCTAESSTSPQGTTSTPGTGAATGGKCPHEGPPLLDPASLPACGAANSGAHCLSNALVPPAMASQLGSCQGGLCVPDKFIKTGGNFIPAKCSSVAGAEGRCLNTVIPQVASQASLLPQANCDANERCVPCLNPFDGKDTGACKLSCDPGPTAPAVKLTECCDKGGTNQGRCLPTGSVPENFKKNLDTHECKKDAELCVPVENTDPAFKAIACSANGFLVGNYSGVCVSKCLKFGIQRLALAQGSCDDLHLCAPCINPLDGKPTGAPGCPP